MSISGCRLTIKQWKLSCSRCRLPYQQKHIFAIDNCIAWFTQILVAQWPRVRLFVSFMTGSYILWIRPLFADCAAQHRKFHRLYHHHRHHVYFRHCQLQLHRIIYKRVRADGSTPVPPGRGASRMLRGLMLRDLALLLVNRPKKNVYIFS